MLCGDRKLERGFVISLPCGDPPCFVALRRNLLPQHRILVIFTSRIPSVSKCGNEWEVDTPTLLSSSPAKAHLQIQSHSWTNRLLLQLPCSAGECRSCCPFQTNQQEIGRVPLPSLARLPTLSFKNAAMGREFVNTAAVLTILHEINLYCDQSRPSLSASVTCGLCSVSKHVTNVL